MEDYRDASSHMDRDDEDDDVDVSVAMASAHTSAEHDVDIDLEGVEDFALPEDVDHRRNRLPSTPSLDLHIDLSVIEKSEDDEVRETRGLMERMSVPEDEDGTMSSASSSSSSISSAATEESDVFSHRGRRTRSRSHGGEQTYRDRKRARDGTTTVTATPSNSRHETEEEEEEEEEEHSRHSHPNHRDRQRHRAPRRQDHKSAPSTGDASRHCKRARRACNSEEKRSDKQPARQRAANHRPRRNRNRRRGASPSLRAHRRDAGSHERAEERKVDLTPLDALLVGHPPTGTSWRVTRYLPDGLADQHHHHHRYHHHLEVKRLTYDAKVAVGRYIDDVEAALSSQARPDMVAAAISSALKVSAALSASLSAVLDSESADSLVRWLDVVDRMAHRLYGLLASPHAATLSSMWRKARLASRDDQAEGDAKILCSDAHLPAFGCLVSPFALADAISRTANGCSELALLVADRVLSIERAAVAFGLVPPSEGNYSGRLEPFDKVFARQARVGLESLDTATSGRLASPVAYLYASTLSDDDDDDAPIDDILSCRVIASRLALVACLAFKCPERRNIDGDRATFAPASVELINAWLSADYLKVLPLPKGRHADRDTGAWIDHPLMVAAVACLREAPQRTLEPARAAIANVALSALSRACREWAECRAGSEAQATEHHAAYPFLHKTARHILWLVLDHLLPELRNASASGRPLTDCANDTIRKIICGSGWLAGSTTSQAPLLELINDWKVTRAVEHGQALAEETTKAFLRFRRAWGVYWMASNA